MYADDARMRLEGSKAELASLEAAGEHQEQLKEEAQERAAKEAEEAAAKAEAGEEEASAEEAPAEGEKGPPVPPAPVYETPETQEQTAARMARMGELTGTKEAPHVRLPTSRTHREPCTLPRAGAFMRARAGGG